MKIYTKAGDDGSTSLLGAAGARVRKSDLRIECYGTIDELNATVGWVAVSAQSHPIAGGPPGEPDRPNPESTPPAAFADELTRALREVQNELFVIGSHLAVADGAAVPPSLPPLEESAISRLEMQIDAATATLPPLRNFILPGGTELAARLHVARTVCRRAERQLVRFAQDRPVAATILTYLNRLSDWLFVQARAANHAAGVADVEWNVKG
jgi:cob(I)alamin adenosyltransferase